MNLHGLRGAVFVIIVALLIGYGLDQARGTSLASGEPLSNSVLLDMAPSDHQHGPTSTELNHCGTASCAGVYLLQASIATLRTPEQSAPAKLFFEDRQIRPTYLDRDPPVPRFPA